MKYKVIQQHFGDKQYFTGDERIVENEQDAQELIKMGLIAPVEPVTEETGEHVEPSTDETAKSKTKKTKEETA